MQTFVIAALLGAALAQNQGEDPQACAQRCNAATNKCRTQPHAAGAMGQDCVDKCNAANDHCRSQPNANQAYCSSQYASCLGYNPYQSGGFVTPTACSAQGVAPTGTGSPMPTGGSMGQDCVDKCNAAADKCRTQPHANQSYCSSQYASCLGYNPYQEGGFVTPTACSGSGVAPTGTAPVIAGGSQLSPAYAAMAVGLMALF